MPTIGSETKTVRICAEDLEIMYELMKDGTSWSGAVHKLCQSYSGVPTYSEPKVEEKADDPTMKDIEEMVTLCGCTLEKFLKDVDKGLTEGALVVNNNGLTLSEMNTEDFEQACRDKCLDPQSVLDKATKAVERGML